MNSLIVRPSTRHLQFLDGMRALAALYVVMHHVMIHYYYTSTADLQRLSGWKRISIAFFFSGHYAVNFFIVISGFSLMLSVVHNDYRLNGGIRLYLWKRIKRIVPPYYLAILFSLLLIWLFIGNKTGTHWDLSVPVHTIDILAHFFLVHDFSLSTLTTINHALWSIAVEFRVYLFFPLLLFLWRRMGVATALTGATAISVLGLCILIYARDHVSSDVNAYFSGVSPYLILFMTGMLAADLSLSRSTAATRLRHLFLNSKLWHKAGLLIFVLLIFKAARYLIWKGFAEGSAGAYVASQVIDIILGFSYAALLLICTIAAPSNRLGYWLNRGLSWKPLVFIGSFSYSLYLIHSPIIQVFSQYLVDPLGLPIFSATWLLLLITLPGAIGISYIFFLFCERPFMTKKLKKAAEQSLNT